MSPAGEKLCAVTKAVGAYFAMQRLREELLRDPRLARLHRENVEAAERRARLESRP